jgi:hypothetical protein
MQDASPRPLETLELTRDAERAAQTFATPDLSRRIFDLLVPTHVLQKSDTGFAIRTRAKFL